MRLIFSDHFAGSSLNTTGWDTCYPWATSGAGCTNFGNPELEWYLPSQDVVANNALHLQLSKTPTPGTNRTGQPMTYQWRSGIVSTYRSAEFTYGYVSVRARVPAGSGLWSALYLLPQSQQWPPEIDLAEIDGTMTNQYSVTFHPVRGNWIQNTVQTPDLSAAYHTYAVDWEPSSLTWYLDGKVVDRYQGALTPSEPMYFLADLAVESIFGNAPNASTPAKTSLDIQSVAIYQH